ncbi:alpha/beta fold hydrolase [Sphingomonas sp. 28-63-12]|uniref:alpha/beta fold hydrolase n=1 Tax=Sphingomonas sp. 28-63-12 TaxID=1970434 RepID=UPI000BCD4E7E|nr:MAG: alpha/beta hydrolase [Sphingomonas sp. 28-63-12]
MAAYENRYWWSNDGIRLHARDYPARDAQAAAGRPPILCLPGLTRNARDFDVLAERLSAEWRVLVVNLRGRGDSGYAKDPMSYAPLVYVQDVEKLLGELGCDRYVAIGTSLGGIVTMLLAGAARETLAGVVLNDVGPEIDPVGLSRIRTYVGKSSSWPTWMHAARAVADSNADSYPHYDIGDWLVMAKRLYRLNASGRIVLDYDMKIAEPFRVPGNEAGPDMWRALDRLAGVPVLIVRGAMSDILPAAVADRMVETLGDASLVTIPNVGHAPTMDEPEAVAAIDRLLAGVSREPVAA